MKHNLQASAALQGPKTDESWLTHQIFVVDGLEDDLNVALEKPRLDEVVSLQAVGLALAGVNLALVAVLHGGSLRLESG